MSTAGSPSRFLSRSLIIAVQRDLIEAFGGEHGLRDEGLLESALAQPEASFGGELLHPSVHDQAAAYLYHLCLNHPFIDGNKRIAFAAADTFLRINGFRLTLSDDEVVELVLAVAQGQVEKTELAERLRSGSTQQPSA